MHVDSMFDLDIAAFTTFEVLNRFNVFLHRQWILCCYFFFNNKKTLLRLLLITVLFPNTCTTVVDSLQAHVLCISQHRCTVYNYVERERERASRIFCDLTVLIF